MVSLENAIKKSMVNQKSLTTILLDNSSIKLYGTIESYGVSKNDYGKDQILLSVTLETEEIIRKISNELCYEISFLLGDFEYKDILKDGGETVKMYLTLPKRNGKFTFVHNMKGFNEETCYDSNEYFIHGSKVMITALKNTWVNFDKKTFGLYFQPKMITILE